MAARPLALRSHHSRFPSAAKRHWRRLAVAVITIAIAALGWVWRKTTQEAPPPPAREASAAVIARTDQARRSAGAFSARISRDRGEALDLAARSARDADERYQLLSRLLPELAATHPLDAWRWAVRHQRAWSESGQAALTELVLARVAVDLPEQVAPLVLANETADPAWLDQGVAALLQAHRVADARALVENWAQQAAPGQEARAACERIASALAQASPVEAAAWLLSLPPSTGRDAALGVVADGWAARDAAAAIAWAETLSPAETRAAAVERAFARWTEQDGESALRWLVAREASADADRLIARWLAISEKIRAQPAAAAPWLALIRDPALRARSAALFSLP